MSSSNEDVNGRDRRGGVVERAPVYGWARRAVYGGGGTAGWLARGLASSAGVGLGQGGGAAAVAARGSGRRLSAPAVSVGNVTLGGGGKTSLVEWIVREGAPPGAAVAVLSRGYGRASDAALALAPGQAPFRVGDAGDEPALLARAGAWVGISADRFLAAQAVEGWGRTRTSTSSTTASSTAPFPARSTSSRSRAPTSSHRRAASPPDRSASGRAGFRPTRSGSWPGRIPATPNGRPVRSARRMRGGGGSCPAPPPIGALGAP